MRKYEDLKRAEEERRLFRLRLVALVVMTVVLLMLVSGCNLTDKLQALDGKAPSVSQNLPDIPTGGLNTVQPQVPKVKVTVYFKNKEASNLVPVPVEVDKAPGIAREAVEALCSGPDQDVDAAASMPEGVQVRSIKLKSDGTCVVDLDPPAASVKLTPKGEALAVYALVDTLTEFRNVKQVQILVGGLVKDTLAGHIPIDEPLLRNMTFVKRNG